MIDRANEFVDEAERKAKETTLSAAEVISLALTAGFVAVGGGSGRRRRTRCRSREGSEG